MTPFTNKYILLGYPVDLDPGDSPIPLATFEFSEFRIRIALEGKTRPFAVAGANLWEHTLWELDRLSLALREAAAGPTPKSTKIERGQSTLWANMSLSMAYSLEIGLSVSSPRDKMAYCFCEAGYSRLRDKHYVYFGIAIGRRYGAVIFGPDEARAFADWIDHQCLLLQERVRPPEESV